MTLNEISYELLLILRAGYIGDDERIDSRLLNALVRQYREKYILQNSKNGDVNELYRQHTSIPVSISEKATFSRLESTNKIPRLIIGKQGPLIEEIYSPYVEEYPFTIVNRTHLRYAGNGKFNQSIIYVSYDNDKLYFMSRNDAYKNIETISMAAIFEDPEDVSGFDVDTDDYPIDLDGVNFIKDNFMKSDVRLLLAQHSDEINDASGEIKE